MKRQVMGMAMEVRVIRVRHEDPHASYEASYGVGASVCATGGSSGWGGGGGECVWGGRWEDGCEWRRWEGRCGEERGCGTSPPGMD
jgi:hypothetical protein